MHERALQWLDLTTRCVMAKALRAEDEAEAKIIVNPLWKQWWQWIRYDPLCGGGGRVD